MIIHLLYIYYQALVILVRNIVLSKAHVLRIMDGLPERLAYLCWIIHFPYF